MYDMFQVNVHADVRDKEDLTLTQIIEAGLLALDVRYDEHTFYVYPRGVSD